MIVVCIDITIDDFMLFSGKTKLQYVFFCNRTDIIFMA